MKKQHLQLEQYSIHTGLTKAESSLLLYENIQYFGEICLNDLLKKGVLNEKDGIYSIKDEFHSILQNENQEGLILIAFAKKNVVLFGYEIPILKLLLSPIHKNLLIDKIKIIQKVFFDWLDHRLYGYDNQTTIKYYQAIQYTSD